MAASCTPDATIVETQTFVMTANLTVGAPVGPRAVGDKLYLVFVDSNGGHTIAWDSVYRNCQRPAAGAANTRLSCELRWDGQSWQFAGGSTAFA